jgi:iron-sulfur cluster assembly protein
VITVTPEAIEHLEEALKKGVHPGVVRLGVTGAGCNGYSYVLKLEHAFRVKDTAFKLKHDVSWSVGNVKFVVDEKSMAILTGSTLTWAHRGLMSGFEFVNPNEASRCGCGVSFTLKRDI